MAIEREHKFLINDNFKLPELGQPGVVSIASIVQGYLHNSVDKTVRVRSITLNELVAFPIPVMSTKGTITVKGPTIDTDRVEFEYNIPFTDAAHMLSMCEDLIIKDRYTILAHLSNANLVWEVDVFKGKLQGLILVELELPANVSIELSDVEFPEWLGTEVTADPRYYNSVLLKNGIPLQG
jgi:CYTH domain-containing protein